MLSRLSGMMSQTAASRAWRCQQQCKVCPQRPCGTSCLGFWAGQFHYFLPFAAFDGVTMDPLAFWMLCTEGL